MLRDNARGHIQRILGFRSDLEAEIIQELQRAQRLLEQGKTLPWFLVAINQEVETNPSSPTTIPTGFIREVEPARMRYYPDGDNSTTPVFLRKMSHIEAQIAYPSESPGTAEYPIAYNIYNDNLIQFYPRTATTQTLYWDFYKKAAVLSTDIENVWLAHCPDLLIGMAGRQMAQILGKQRAEKQFAEMAAASWDAIFKETILREVSGREYIIGRNS